MLLPQPSREGSSKGNMKSKLLDAKFKPCPPGEHYVLKLVKEQTDDGRESAYWKCERCGMKVQSLIGSLQKETENER